MINYSGCCMQLGNDTWPYGYMQCCHSYIVAIIMSMGGGGGVKVV